MLWGKKNTTIGWSGEIYVPWLEISRSDWAFGTPFDSHAESAPQHMWIRLWEFRKLYEIDAPEFTYLV